MDRSQPDDGRRLGVISRCPMDNPASSRSIRSAKGLQNQPIDILVSLVCLLSMSMGCLSPQQSPRAGQPELGCVFILPGVNSRPSQFTPTILGLQEAGLDHAIEIVEWGNGPFRSLRNLVSLRRNLGHAERIAGQVADYRQAHPDTPLTLVGFSGGGGLAVLVAKALPECQQVDRLILVGAALAPDYDLVEILPRIGEGIVSFYSPRDWLVLGVGTGWFGTIDRQFTQSAGRAGFLDGNGGLLETDEIVQIEWEPSWRTLGHPGGHLGWMSREWARVVLAPAIDPSLILRVAG
jgi:hypothetical protein